MKSIPKTLAVLLLAATCSISAPAQTMHNINTDGNITISSGGAYIIEGTGSATTNRIKVNSGITADITLNNVNINVSNACAFDMSGATVSLTLEGDNALTSGGNNAGINNDGGNLTISGSGTLEVHGGNGSTNGSGAGIGGNGADCRDCGGGYGGRLTVNSGSVTAYGGNGNSNSSGGAGIGGGGCGNCNSGSFCAGNWAGDSNPVTVNGGIVKAFGGKGSNNSGGAAGIGGGGGGWKSHGGSGHLTVNGGSITAIGGSSDQPSGGGHGAGIGGGGGGASNSGGTGESGDGTVIINGGTVTATATGTAYGIGTGGYAVDGQGGHGSLATLSAITITGGSIKASNVSNQPVNGAGAVYLNTLTIGNTPVTDGTPVTAGSIGGIPCDEIPDASSGKYGIKDVQTRNGGKVYFYLPAGEGWVILEANDREYGKNYTRYANNNDNDQTVALPYDISVSNARISFASASYGYGVQASRSVDVINTGYNSTGDLTVTLGGINADKFELLTRSIPSIAAGSRDILEVMPNMELDAGSYAATVTVQGDNDIIASFSIHFTVDRAIPEAGDLAFDLTPVTYNGSPQSLTVTAKSEITGLGTTIEVYYDGYPVEPTDVGSYPVTVNIDEGTNYTDVTGLSLGDYTIVLDEPTEAELSFNLTPVTYDGKPHAPTVTVDPGITGLGPIIAIKYNGSTTVPTAAGTYAVTVDIAAGTLYAAVTDLPVGSFTIAKAEPTVDVLDFTLSDIVCTGRPYPVPVTAGTDIEGLGEITVYYNGSTTVPVDPGDYAVTIDIAEGANYTAVTRLSLGAFTIQEPPMPIPTLHSVLLPSAPGLTTDPPAGTYHVSRGTNFTFTLTPDASAPEGASPQVQTNRRTPDQPNASGIRITPNADGSYTVVIIGIRQDIAIALSIADSKSDPTDNESVAAGLEVYAAPGVLIVANSRPDAATLYVYSPAGTLVRLATVPPGTTRLSVPTGIYIVTDGGAFRCKTAVTR